MTHMAVIMPAEGGDRQKRGLFRGSYSGQSLLKVETERETDEHQHDHDLVTGLLGIQAGGFQYPAPWPGDPSGVRLAAAHR